MDRMLRPQGLFHNLAPTPADWQQHTQAVPGGYPPPGQHPAGGQYPPPGAPYQQPAPYPPGPPYPPAGAQPGGGPQAWPGAGLPGAAQPGPAQPGGPYPNGQFPGGQFPGGGFNPGNGPDQPPRKPGLSTRLRSRGPLLPVLVAVALIVIVVGAIVLSTRGSSSPSATAGSGPSSAPASSAASSPASASGSAPSAAGSPARQRAATALAGLLSQSGTDHSDVNAAVTNVEGCKALTPDAQTLTRAAANRRTLLAKLAKLPGRGALSAAMLADLTSGWQASATVDSDLAKWAASESRHCKKNDFKNPNYTASLPFDNQATSGKSEFVKKWNVLARKYKLTKYQPSQI